MMMNGETFYGRHTAQHQLQSSKTKVKKDSKVQEHPIKTEGVIVMTSIFPL